MELGALRESDLRADSSHEYMLPSFTEAFGSLYIVFSNINDISCVSQLISENSEKEGCTSFTMNTNPLGKDFHLPSAQGQDLLTLEGTSGPCPDTNKNCQQNHSAQGRSITKNSLSLSWAGGDHRQCTSELGRPL